jgi:hypothetical protein
MWKHEIVTTFLCFTGSSGTVVEVQDVTSITLALKTLGSFDFEGMYVCIEFFDEI